MLLLFHKPEDSSDSSGTDVSGDEEATEFLPKCFGKGAGGFSGGDLDTKVAKLLGQKWAVALLSWTPAHGYSMAVFKPP